MAKIMRQRVDSRGNPVGTPEEVVGHRVEWVIAEQSRGYFSERDVIQMLQSGEVVKTLGHDYWLEDDDEDEYEYED